MTKKTQHSTEDQVSALSEILDKEPASSLLTIPGVWEILSEHYNNEIIAKLAEWDGEEEEEEEDNTNGAELIPDFFFAWLNAERNRLSVIFDGEVPTITNPEGESVEDPGSVSWPTDEEISAAVGKRVAFSDKGDSLCEGIFHAV